MSNTLFSRYYSSFLPTLALGDRNFSVIMLQKALYLTGYYQDVIDGIFGATTLAAVQAFQTARNLTADGVVSLTTWEQISQDAELDQIY
ncbi:MAG: peptidoglycan-binding protein [Synechococcales cyanobacterium T60_A2020_003]|nr:peptidoglycan-binding protein [Synechococcales cyanobacterium T60_A2020_003]